MLVTSAIIRTKEREAVEMEVPVLKFCFPSISGMHALNCGKSVFFCVSPCSLWLLAFQFSSLTLSMLSQFSLKKREKKFFMNCCGEERDNFGDLFFFFFIVK